MPMKHLHHKSFVHPNMITYARLYQDIPFTSKSFTDIDALILAQMSYYIYNASSSGKNAFSHPVSHFLVGNPQELITGMLTADDDHVLIELLKQGGRHGDLKVANHVDIFDKDTLQQFSATTYRIKRGEYYIAFRGTDNTIIGWQEDFNLSFLSEIPSQKSAVQYALEMMKRYRGHFYFGGHSKGGNLAVYAAAMLPPKMQRRVTRIYNFDGPGFSEDFYHREEYLKIRDFVYKYIPQSSIIGLLLEKEKNYMVIESSAANILQHNPYSWIVLNDRFQFLDSIDSSALLWKTSIDHWLAEMDLNERRIVVETLFGIISSTGATCFSEMTEPSQERIKNLISSITDTDSAAKHHVKSALIRLFQISAKEFKKQRFSI